MAIDRIFNVILSVAIIVAIPILIFLGISPTLGMYARNVYYAALLSLEIISIVKRAKHKC